MLRRRIADGSEDVMYNYEFIPNLDLGSKEKICGHCKWHIHEDITDGWVCSNNRSDYVADWTEYDDSCDDFEPR
jgi:hypothetical protein